MRPNGGRSVKAEALGPDPRGLREMELDTLEGGVLITSPSWGGRRAAPDDRQMAAPRLHDEVKGLPGWSLMRPRHLACSPL